MNSPDARICRLLGEALDLLDDAGEHLAAIYVSQAMETLRCPVIPNGDQAGRASGPLATS